VTDGDDQSLDTAAPEASESFWGNLLGPMKGFAVTFRQMFRPRVTVKYPKERRAKPQRFHGRHILNRYEDGMEKCIGCELCAGVCPARCIYVRGADNPIDAPVSPGERFGFVYEINMLRCIFCGLCVEACPTEAITMTQFFEMSVTERPDAIYTKDELLVEPDGTPNHPQPEGPLIDLAELSIGDGWLRATAPSGRAAYEGVVAWTGSATSGLLPPEVGQSVGSAVPEKTPGPEADLATWDESAGTDEPADEDEPVDSDERTNADEGEQGEGGTDDD
jgi:NADH-quinone oxidoreductase subunit I